MPVTKKRAAQQQPQPQPPAPNYRLRTITVFIDLARVDPDAATALQSALALGDDAATAAAADAHAARLWGDALKQTGEFLGRAKAHFEQAIPGLEVQTVRAASQGSMCEVFEVVTPEGRGGAADDTPPSPAFPTARESPVAALAAALERLAHREGVPMLSLGAVVDDDSPWATLRHVPAVLEATQTVSCSFEALLRHSQLNRWARGGHDRDQERNYDCEDDNAYATYSPPALRLAAEVKLEVARRTNGHGNFRFAIAAGCSADGGHVNGWKQKVRHEPCECVQRKCMRRREAREVEPSLGPMPFFPVAGGNLGDWQGSHTNTPRPIYFALGCETDGLLRVACERVRAAFDAAATAPAGAGAGGSGEGKKDEDGRTSTAELACSATHGRVTALLKWVLTEKLSKALNPLRNAALKLDASEKELMADEWQRTHGKRHRDFEEIGYGCYTEPWGFCGVDTSLAPGLDTPSLTGSFELLLPLLQAGGKAPSSSSSSSSPLPRFGDPGTLALCSAVTRALQNCSWDHDEDNPDDDPDDVPAEPPTTCGYCGLMLAVLEDQGLAEAAAEGRLSIERLLSWSSVCGTGLDTVPVPGPRWRVAAAAGAGAATVAAGDKRRSDGRPVKKEGGGKVKKEEAGDGEDAAARRHDEALAGRIASVAADVCAMALRLRKPLSVRLLPLPMLKAGDETRRALGGHPYLLDSRVMEL